MHGKHGKHGKHAKWYLICSRCTLSVCAMNETAYRACAAVYSSLILLAPSMRSAAVISALVFGMERGNWRFLYSVRTSCRVQSLYAASSTPFSFTSSPARLASSSTRWIPASSSSRSVYAAPSARLASSSSSSSTRSICSSPPPSFFCSSKWPRWYSSYFIAGADADADVTSVACRKPTRPC